MSSTMNDVFHWRSNPFSFRILPDVVVGNQHTIDSIVTGVQNGDKFLLLLGPTGSGKTTLLKHISVRFPECSVIYLPKPPKNPEDWVGILSLCTRPGILDRLLRRTNCVSLYTLSEKLNHRLGKRHCILFVDECHEATQESLEWLRTLTDQTENLTTVLAGLPVFEEQLKGRLETFLKRVTVQIDLGCLSHAETREFVKKRIENEGGDDIRPFTAATLEFIHQKTGGFPREILKTCNQLVQRALQKGLTTIDTDFLNETDIPTRVTKESLDTLPAKQKLIIDTLSHGGEMTPTELVREIKASGEYKDDENAVRSVNNLVRRLMSDGFLERRRFGKAYRYKISPRYQSLMVSA